MARVHQSVSVSASGRAALLGIGLCTALPRTWLIARAWIARSRQREALVDLDDGMLRDIGVNRERDIGVSREEARCEIDKLLWGT
jgi:uncharacterized protein YjiS (DUF1127 family)